MTTLKDFALKYNMNAEELLELLIFEGFPISHIDSEIDESLHKYLLEYSNKSNKKGFFKKYKSNIQKGLVKEIKKNILYKRPMTISECAKTTQFSVSYYINFFLKKKKLYSISSFLSIEDISKFASEHDIEVIEENESKKEVNIILKNKTNIEGDYVRNPIVVVVGHVDHGKTTLLDVIRNQSIAKSEKGGITQHIGAYEVSFSDRSITFLDTPGHEAFIALRSRGVTIADIAILVIAADDGIKPQTIESIKILKEMKVNIIIAITKIDKVGQKNFDHLYTDLTKYDLVPESWGGNIPIIFVAATKNQGIKELLEAILLIAELADLKTKLNTNATGYILESKMEKGRGAIATIILQAGNMQIGDTFYANTTWGKIITAYDSNNKKIVKLYPGKPYVISGFDSMPFVGSYIIQSDLKTAKAKASLNKEKEIIKNNKTINNIDIAKNYNIVIKADVYSSLQALDKMIEDYQNNDKFFYKPNIIYRGVGEINANDISMASSGNAKIYSFNIKKVNDKSILSAIKENNIEIFYFDVIYSLLDHIEKNIEKEKTNIIELKKIGELEVLKIFFIKSIGQIIGFRVLNGIVKPGSVAKVYRNKEFIGKGNIKSLEKERVSVKELGKGYEGALSLNSHFDIEKSDIIEIYS